MALFTIRPAKSTDCAKIAELVKELAKYENSLEKATLDGNALIRDGFGCTPYFHCLVAEINNENEKPVVVGYALYFYIYSTWRGKSLYMEDLYVQPLYRKRGIGKVLLQNIAQVAVSTECVRLDFSVLDWNTPSIEFYKSKGAVDLTAEEGWHSFRITGDKLTELAKCSSD